jgi:hypothetical protein
MTALLYAMVIYGVYWESVGCAPEVSERANAEGLGVDLEGGEGCRPCLGFCNIVGVRETGPHGLGEGLASIAVSRMLQRIYQGQWEVGWRFITPLLA